MKRIIAVTDMIDGGGRKANGIRVAEALGLLGHSVARVGHEDATEAENLAGADLILCFGTLVSAEAKKSGYFRKIRAAMRPSAVLALWYFDLCTPGMVNSPWKYQVMREIAPRLDFLAMTDHSFAWEGMVPRFLHLLQGIDPAEFWGDPPPAEPRARDVIFTGGFDLGFEERRRDIEKLKGLGVGVFGRNSKKRLYGRGFVEQYQRSRVAYVPAPPTSAKKNYWSNRIYLAAATGTPCVVGWAEGLEEHYQEGEVRYFRPSEGPRRAVEELLADPLTREKVGAAGRARTFRDHSYLKRAEKLMRSIFGGGAE